MFWVFQPPYNAQKFSEVYTTPCPTPQRHPERNLPPTHPTHRFPKASKALRGLHRTQVSYHKLTWCSLTLFHFPSWKEINGVVLNVWDNLNLPTTFQILFYGFLFPYHIVSIIYRLRRGFRRTPTNHTMPHAWTLLRGSLRRSDTNPTTLVDVSTSTRARCPCNDT